MWVALQCLSRARVTTFWNISLLVMFIRTTPSKKARTWGSGSSGALGWLKVSALKVAHLTKNSGHTFISSLPRKL